MGNSLFSYSGVQVFLFFLVLIFSKVKEENTTCLLTEIGYGDSLGFKTWSFDNSKYQ